MNHVRILVADDHRIVAEGIRSLLEAEFGLVDIVEDGRALLVAAEKLRPMSSLRTSPCPCLTV